MQLTDNQLEMVYSWVDKVPQSRPKKNIMRDFADGSQIAHVIRHYLSGQYKGMVHVHNYVETSSKSVKLENWSMLNQRVLAKLGMNLNKEEMIGVVNCQYLMIETILFKVKRAIENFNKNPPDDFSSAKAAEYVQRNLAQRGPGERLASQKKSPRSKKSPRGAASLLPDHLGQTSKKSKGSTPRGPDSQVKKFYKTL